MQCNRAWAIGERMLQGYELLDSLGRTGGSWLCRAMRLADRKPVLLKVLENGTPEQLDRFNRKYELLESLHLPEVVRPVALVSGGAEPAMVLEDRSGVRLESLLASPLPMVRALRLARKLAHALAGLHEAQIVDHDLRPANLLVDADGERICLVDLSRASSRQPAQREDSVPAGDLAYISPEQTGRLHSAIDERSDLYSVGVVLYRMFSGELPFHARDPLEWVHAHLARTPVSLAQRMPAVPQVLSDLVDKLLSKAPDERYQSARGLEADLARCLEQWEASGKIEPFPLAREDFAGRFEMPGKLYGRERERAILLESAHRAAQGNAELVLVSGYSGIGKSALVHELQKPLTREGGNFIAGKFEQGRRDIPYAAFGQAFRALVQQLLAGSEEEVGQWRKRLTGALGSNAAVITAILPELELIIGKPAPVAPVAAVEAKNRFHATFHRFLGVFPGPGHPLVLFLDDLQWADSASLELLEEFLAHARGEHLLVVGAYRDNEVTPAHPLLQLMQRVRQAGTRVTEVVLQPLTPEDLGQLLADALRCTPEAAAPLARLVRTKTGGDPFFATQFLTTLSQDHLIEFAPEENAWHWDVGRIASRDYTDNVVELMLARLRRLPQETQALMTLCACLGNRADVSTLAVSSERSPDAVHAVLWAARHQGLMLRTDGAYRFLHDRIRQGASSLIGPAQRAQTHLEIARRLLAHASHKEGEVSPFEIANQFRRGLSRLEAPAEKDQVARLFLACGLKAKASSAYAAAEGFFASAMDLLDEASWKDRYELTWELHLQQADCEWLVGRFEEAERLLTLLLARAQTNLHRLTAREIQVRLHAIRGELSQSIESGGCALRLIGLEMPAHPTPEQVKEMHEATWRQLEGRSIESLLELPQATDPEMKAALSIASSMLDVAAFTDKNLVPWLSSFMVSTSIRHGNTDSSPGGYAAFAMCLLDLERRDEAYRFGRLASDLIERLHLDANRAKVATYVDGTLNPWIKNYRSGLAHLDDAAHQSARNGDFLWAGYAFCEFIWLLFLAGEPLTQVKRESEERLALVRSMKAYALSDNFVSLQQHVAHLRGAPPAGFDEAAWETTLEKERMPVVVCTHCVWKMQRQFLFGDLEGALASSAKAQANLWGLYRLSTLAEFQYYDALIRAARYRDVSPALQQEDLATMRAHEQALGASAAGCPQNFGSKHALVSAELSRLAGRDVEAARGYERAVGLARAHGLVQNEAIANEAAARFHRALGLESIAAMYFREARACYARWGADAKVTLLERADPRLFARARRALEERAPPELRAGQLDLLTAIKASQAISRQIVLSELLETLLRIVLESAGAQTGSLLLVRGDQLAWAAVASVEPGGVSVRRRDDSAPSAAELPLSVLQYVRRSREHVLLDDGQPNPFASDPYFAARPPKSMLCLPLLLQSELIGLLFLENSLVSHAFTPERLAMLELLSGQVASSLENAQLYAELRRENAERQQVEAALRESQALVQAVVDNAPASIFVKDLEGRFLLVNRHLAKSVQRDRDAMLGQTDAGLFPAEQAAAVRANDLRVLAAGVPQEVEETVALEDGPHTYLSIKAPLTDSSGRVFGLCGISTDITARKRAEAALRRSEERLRQAQKMEAIGNLAGGIAHDFNNLLSIIMSYSTLLARDLTESDPRRADLQEIEAAAMRAAELTRQLLAFGRRQILQPGW